MPIWVPFVVAGIGLALASTAGWYFGGEAGMAVSAVGILAAAVAVVVAGHRLLGLGQLPVWAQWALLVTPWVVAAVGMLWPRSAPAPRRPGARCARCGADLYLDHAGRDRYYGLTDGYLCPPALRVEGDRRHHPVLLSLPRTEPMPPPGAPSTC